jgi:predicted enzyme related to lactoylglutathione lyase
MTHHRSRVLQFVIDVDDLDRGVAFWSAALDATEEPLSEKSRPIYRLLRLPDAEIRVLLQRTDDEKVSKERMHLDLETDDIEAEVQRLEALGATRYDHQQERGFDFWVMRDPKATSSACSIRTSRAARPAPAMDHLGHVCNVTPATARLLRWSPDPGWAADP